MCEDCREQGIKRKIAQFEEPRESPRGTRKRSEKTKGRKARLDELKAAEKDFWLALEWDEEAKGSAANCKIPGHKGKGWVCHHGFGLHSNWLKDRTKKLDKIYLACQRDGII